MAPVNRYVNPRCFCSTQTCCIFTFLVMLGGKRVANRSFLGKWPMSVCWSQCTVHAGQVQPAHFSHSTFWYPRNQADVEWLSHWEGYRCHRWFIYRYLLIQVDNPKAKMSLSEAEPWWWEVLLYVISLFLGSSELKLAGDTVSPLFSLPFLFWLQKDLRF